MASCQPYFQSTSAFFGVLYLTYTHGRADTHRVFTVTHGLMLYQFAEVHVSTPVDDAVYVTNQLVRCLADLGGWMKSSRLKLNYVTRSTTPQNRDI